MVSCSHKEFGGIRAPFLYTQVGRGDQLTNRPPNPPKHPRTCHTKHMQNKHIEHPEDTILTGDLTALDWFEAAGTLSVKMDGAPAIVWGRNPATGNFFVGTKSVFNKVKIKINESHADIDANHNGEVAEILHACFDWLPPTDSIYQGDFIGFGGKSEYTPNTITYSFGEVIHQEIIIAPHTRYEANDDLRDSWAIPLTVNLGSTDFCKFVKPQARIFSGDYTKCAGSFGDLSEPIQFARTMATLVEFATPKEAIEIKKQLNACIREGKEINPDEFDNPAVISYWKLIKSIKEDALYLCRNDGPAAYIGHDRIDSEGYVYSNEFGTMKLVNRERFSNANFNNAKFNKEVCQ